MDNRKEDMARLIARNMAAADKEKEYSSGGDIVGAGVTDFGSDNYAYAAAGAVRAGASPAGRTAKKPSASGAKRSGTKASAKTGSKAKSKKKKKKARARKAIVAICVAIVLVAAVGGGAVYLAGLNTYKGVFLDNTYINGVNVSGLSQSQALEEIKAQAVIPEKITITKKDDSVITINLADIGYKENNKELITEYYSQQDHYKWVSSKFDKQEYTIENPFVYNKDQLEAILKHKIVDSEMTHDPIDAYIKEMSDGSYTVVSEVGGDKVDSDKAGLLYEFVENELDEGHFDISVGGVNCYEKARVTAEELYEDCEKLNNLHSMHITFDFGYAEETLDGSTIMDWVEVNPDSPVERFSVDKDKAMAYVETLADKYDTFGKDRTFKTTNRGTITIPQGQGCYGWWLDQEEMRNFICRHIEDCESVDTEPIYYVNPDSQYSYTCDPSWRTADKDYGDTYFEVDLSAQHVWYYEDGEVKMESDIVSGYPSESRNTPGGVYKLWIKERGKTLVGSSDGQSYASYVEYWNNISTISIGFHDASWQNGVFGGEKYKSSTWGSHGCINMPYDKAQYIYENCDYGTPVFAYWSDGGSDDE